jgi:hypothetical protein
MTEPSAGWICATRTPAGIAESETSLTAEVDMGSDLPLRPLLFEPKLDFASFWNGEQVWRSGLKSRARLRFPVGVSVLARVLRRHCAQQQFRR